ncbi:MAG: hypothetical protein AB7N65_07150 [Vicinamibacterales bacterium]
MPLWISWVPSLLALLLIGVGLLSGQAVRWSTGGAAVGLAAWNLWLVSRAGEQPLSLTVDLRPQHYVQACAQATVLVYWGWYWRPVFEGLSLLAAQLLFAYAFDMLLNWTQRRAYGVGFGPVPVIFSINLFLWFRPEWFACQLLMVAVGFTAKALIRWQRDGRAAHIFNPSSFPLAAASVLLILTGTSDLTRGVDIAISQFYPPQMYLLLFLVGLPGQLLFGVASMTLSAVVTTWLFGLVYLAVTGTYFFLDSYVPIAVFLGMHLLFTDPSTSPRTELGRVIFGVLYGLSSVVLYQLLTSAGLPAFYDKLLQVPLLNLSVRAIDRTVRAGWLAAIDPARLAPFAPARRRHVAYVLAWALGFTVMSLTGGVGDTHPGQWTPFWQQACASGSDRACGYLAQLEAVLCRAGSGWACNEAGRRALGRSTAERGARGMTPQVAFGRGCRLGFVPACRNAARPGRVEQAPPELADYPILLRGSKGPLTERSPAALLAQACRRGFNDACEGSEGTQR